MKRLIGLFCLSALCFAAVPGYAAWISNIGGRTFVCQAEGGDFSCDPPKEDPLKGHLSFFKMLAVSKNSSDGVKMEGKSIKDMFESIMGKNYILLSSELADCSTKNYNSSFRVYNLAGEFKEDLQDKVEVLARISPTTLYFMLYLYGPNEPAPDQVITPEMLDAFCTQTF